MQEGMLGVLVSCAGFLSMCHWHYAATSGYVWQKISFTLSSNQKKIPHRPVGPLRGSSFPVDFEPARVKPN